jgi:hypothetical protein
MGNDDELRTQPITIHSIQIAPKRQSVRRVIAFTFKPALIAINVVAAVLIAIVSYHSSSAVFFQFWALWTGIDVLWAVVKEIHWHAASKLPADKP